MQNYDKLFKGDFDIVLSGLSHNGKKDRTYTCRGREAVLDISTNEPVPVQFYDMDVYPASHIMDVTLTLTLKLREVNGKWGKVKDTRRARPPKIRTWFK